MCSSLPALRHALLTLSRYVGHKLACGGSDVNVEYVGHKFACGGSDVDVEYVGHRLAWGGKRCKCRVCKA